MEHLNLFAKINQLKAEHGIILYGYSFLGHSIEHILMKNNISIEHIWDKSANTLPDIEDLSLPYENGKKEDLLIVCIGNTFIREKIKKALTKRGYTNILPEKLYNDLVRKSLQLYEQNNNFYRDKNIDIKTDIDRLHKAIDFAIETNYIIWNRQYLQREKSRIAKNLFFSGFMENKETEKFYKDYCFNNGLRNLKAICSFDNNCWGKTALGVVYVNPQELLKTDDLFVVVKDPENAAIKDFLNKNEIPWCSITDLELNVFDPKFSSEWFQKERDNILRAYSLLEDEISKKIYVETICNRIAPHLAQKDYYELRSSKPQYFDSDILALSNHESLVDAGAYIGDSMLSFLKSVNGNFDNIFAFEMDEINFEEMRKNLEASDFSSLNIHLYQKGVYSKNKIISYSSNSGGSILGQGVDKSVEVIRLDDFLKNEEVSILKMDIEGSEMDALQGCQNIIKKQKPKIAMSVYHHLYDIWRIPLYLKCLNPKYRFKIRHYTNTVWDTDLYAY